MGERGAGRGLEVEEIGSWERINKTSPLNNNSGYAMSGKTNGEVRSTQGGDLRAVYVEGEADGGRETERLIVRLMKELFFIFP